MGRCLFIRDDASLPYSIIDTSGWQKEEVFIGFTIGEDLPEGEEPYLYYPWQGETKIDNRFENGKLWVNGKTVGIDLRCVKSDNIEDKSNIVAVKATPIHLEQLIDFPNLLVLEILRGNGDLSLLSELITLKKLILWPEITDQYMPYLAQLKKMRELKLTVAGINDKNLKMLAGLIKLKELIITRRNPDISDVDLFYLGQFRNLKTLSLSGFKISKKGLRVLFGLTKLSRLYLRNSMITDEELEYLGCFTNLISLSFDSIAVTDKGISYLTRLKKLKYLYVGSSIISPKGLRKLKMSIPGCIVYGPWKHPWN